MKWTTEQQQVIDLQNEKNHAGLDILRNMDEKKPGALIVMSWIFLIGNLAWTAPTVPLKISLLPYWEIR